MIILTIRAEKPEAEIGLYSDESKLAEIKWEAHRQLAETLHIKIKSLLDSQKLDWSDLEGIVVYKGPGSFTGLRISISAANALAASLKVPIAGTNSTDWIQDGVSQIENEEDEKMILPEYGSAPHITKPRK